MPLPIRSLASALMRSPLSSRPEWQRAKSVLLYAPFQYEPDIWDLLTQALSEGKVVALPLFSAAERQYRACRVRDLQRDIVTGHFGIREPAPTCAADCLNRLDLILVPGVAFDMNCHRLGRGKGHYDQFLAVVEGRKYGVGYDEQLVDRIPLEPHDIALDCILTPTRWIEPSAVGP